MLRFCSVISIKENNDFFETYHRYDVQSGRWLRLRVIFVVLRGNIQATWRHFCGAQRQESASDEFIMKQDQRIKICNGKMQKVLLSQKIFRLRRANYMAFLLKILLFFNGKSRNFEKKCAAAWLAFHLYIPKISDFQDIRQKSAFRSEKIASKVVF